MRTIVYVSGYAKCFEGRWGQDVDNNYVCGWLATLLWCPPVDLTLTKAATITGLLACCHFDAKTSFYNLCENPVDIGNQHFRVSRFRHSCFVLELVAGSDLYSDTDFRHFCQPPYVS